MIEDQAEVASDVARAVRQTWPWAALFAVLAVCTVLLETGMGILMLAGGSFLPPEADPMGIGPWLGLVYLVLGVVYILPTVLMARVAFASARVSTDDGLESVLRAVRAHRDFWIGMGLLTLLTVIAACGGSFALMAGTMFMVSRLS